MGKILTIGETCVEIMRPEPDIGFGKTDKFLGPYASGAPGIYIDTVAKLGHHASIISSVGDDGFGKLICSHLESNGVDCTAVATLPDRPTSVAFVSYNGDGSREFIFYFEIAAVGTIQIPANLPDDIDVLHISGTVFTLSEQVANAALDLIKYYYEKGTAISFDPNVRIEKLKVRDISDFLLETLERTTFLFPADNELLFLTKAETVEKAIDDLFSSDKFPKLKAVAVKYGELGSEIYSRETAFKIPIYQVLTSDATGAGDSYAAGFICAYLEGETLEYCAKYASAAAALNTAAFGPMEATVQRSEVLQLMNEQKINIEYLR